MDLKLALIIAAVDKATGPLGGVSKAVDAVATRGKELMVTGESIAAVGDKLTNFGQRGQAAIASITAPALEVEGALTKLGEVAKVSLGGDVEGTLAATREAALAWSTAHTGSAAEYIAATQAVVAAGLGEADAIDAAAAAMQFATANSVDGAAASKALVSAYENMGDKSADASEEMARLGDVLTRTQQLFQLENVAGMPEAMAKAIPAAKQAGVSFEELAVTMGALERAGFKGEGAATSLGAAITGLEGASQTLGFELARTADGGIDLVGSLANLEGKVGSLENMSPEMAAKLAEAFGPGNEAVLKLLGSSGSLQASLDEVANSTGAAATAAKAFDESGAGSLKIFDQNVAALKVELSAGLMPALLELAPVVTDVVKSVAGFAKENPGITKVAGTLAIVAVAASSIVGPVLSGVGGFLSLGGQIMAAIPSMVSFGASVFSTVVPALVSAAGSAWAFAAALLANPITWIVLAIIAAAVLIYVYWDEIAAYFSGIWSEIKAAFDQGFIQGVAKVLENLDPFKHLLAAFDFLLQEVTGFSLADVGKAIVDGLMAALDFLNPVPRVVAAWESVRAWLGGFSLADVGMAIVAGLLAVLGSFLPLDAIMAGMTAVQSYLSGFSLADAGANIINTLVAGIKSVASLPADAMHEVVAALRAYLPFSPAKVGPLRDLNKIRLVETVAETITPEPIEAAMANAMGGVLGPLTDVPLPTFVGDGARIANDNGGAAVGGRFEVTFNLNNAPGSAVAELEAWIANPSNAERLAGAIDRVKAQRARTAYR